MTETEYENQIRKLRDELSFKDWEVEELNRMFAAKSVATSELARNNAFLHNEVNWSVEEMKKIGAVVGLPNDNDHPIRTLLPWIQTHWKP